MMKDQSRRNLLRALSVGGVASAANLPTSWSRPVVESVVLPAHAQTTAVSTNALTGVECPRVVNSNPPTQSATALTTDPDDDGMRVSFNGCDSLTLNSADDPIFDRDRILFLDVDRFELFIGGREIANRLELNSFDVELGPAGNWEIVAHTFPENPAHYISDVPEGTYTIDLLRTEGMYAGTVWRFSMTVTVTENGAISNRMTLSNVTATQI